MPLPSPGAKSHPRSSPPAAVVPAAPAPVFLIEPDVHSSSKSASIPGGDLADATVMMLFSCNVQASSVKLVEPVHTAAVPTAPAAGPASRTTYFECIN